MYRLCYGYEQKVYLEILKRRMPVSRQNCSRSFMRQIACLLRRRLQTRWFFMSRTQRILWTYLTLIIPWFLWLCPCCLIFDYSKTRNFDFGVQLSWLVCTIQSWWNNISRLEKFSWYFVEDYLVIHDLLEEEEYYRK